MSEDVQFDPLSPDALDNWGPAYAELRQKCPVHHHAGFGEKGFWTASRYKDVRTIMADHRLWSINQGSGPIDTPMGGLTVDPPESKKYRVLVNVGLSAARAAELAPSIEASARRLLAGLAPKGRMDLVNDYAIPLTSDMTASLLGVPVEHRWQWRQWAEGLLESMADEDHNAFHEATKDMHAFLEDEISRRRETGTGDPAEFLTECAQAKENGEYLPVDELARTAGIVFIGGQGTTTALTSMAVLRLLEDRENRWEVVRQNPELIPAVVEESLRFDPPSIGLFRIATQDITMHDRTVPAGDKIMGLFASANRDEEYFSDPETFDIHRPQSQLKRHIAFGAGAHLCPGAPLGRLEAQISLRLLTEHFPDLRLAGEHGKRIQPFFMWGFDALPVQWSTDDPR